MSKSRLFSGKIKKLSGGQLSVDRYEYLDVSQAEPDLGLPETDSSVLLSGTDGARYWSQTLTNVTLDLVTITTGTVNGILTIVNDTESTSTTTGALIISGGLAVGGNIHFGGDLYQNGTLFASGITSDSTITAVSMVLTTSTQATSTETGALVVAGGVGIGGNLYVGGEIVAEKLTIQLTTITTTSIVTDDVFTVGNDTNSVSTETGALTVAGGVGIGKDLQIAGEIFRNGISVGYGYTGSRGYDGSQGYTGSQGETGYVGSQGIPGENGTSGTSGSDGYTGSQGYTGSAGSVVATISTTPPAGPALGDVWIDSATGIQYFYVNDGDSAQWIEFSNPGTAGTSSSGGVATTGTTSTFVIANNTTSTNTTTGALVVAGGVGVGGDINFGGSLYQNGVLFTGGGGGGGGADSYVKTYFWEGALQENVSTKRYYIHVASTLESIGINLGAAGQTQSTIQIKKNGVALNTIVIPANTTYQVETVNHALAVNDYITVDITQSSSAANLYVTFVYRE